MKKLTCELCGSNDFVKEDGLFVCQSCGTKYSPEEARKMMIEGTVEVTGTVKIDNTGAISNYLHMAQSALKASNHKEAEDYCNRIIELEVTNWEAWLIKGKTAGWQSTLQNPRLSETGIAFIKAINYAPDKIKEEVENDTKETLKNLAYALVSLRADRFEKWPDEEECNGFIADINSIIEVLQQYNEQTTSKLNIPETLTVLGNRIIAALSNTYTNTIESDYKKEEYPDKFTWEQYINRIGYCTIVLSFLLTVIEDDDLCLRIYNSLIVLHKEAIESCSYDYEYCDFNREYGPHAVARMEKLLREKGAIPDPENDRYWVKEYTLSESAIKTRKEWIIKYNDEIEKIKKKKEEKNTNKPSSTTSSSVSGKKDFINWQSKRQELISKIENMDFSEDKYGYSQIDVDSFLDGICDLIDENHQIGHIIDAIKRRGFSSSKKGYSTKEVDDFLSEIIDEIGGMQYGNPEM